ncbi:LYR motif-containing protein 4 [Basidiobolus ranarum]|uniref:LYR motif-containing protein 4 n=1 Tax=Basidiobolus ranarum TaxID=34480 RepID=A0ABR2WSG0_9FUNG
MSKSTFNKPFFKLIEHRRPVLSLYRALLREAGKLEEFHHRYLYYTIRERFRFNRSNTSPKQVDCYLDEGRLYLEKLRKLNGEGDSQILKELDDLAWGKTGRLRLILNILKDTSRRAALKYVSDIRSQSARKKDTHPAYRVPIDPRLYTPKYPISPKGRRYAPITKDFHVVTMQLGYKFRRPRHKIQPHWISMMLKNRVIVAQKRVNQWKQLEEDHEHMKVERQFLGNLGQEMDDYESPILQAIQESRKYKQMLDNASNKQDSFD